MYKLIKYHMMNQPICNDPEFMWGALVVVILVLGAACVALERYLRRKT